MFSKLKKLFVKEEEDNSYLYDDDIPQPEDNDNTVYGFTYDNIADPIIEGNVNSKKVLLIVDDLEVVFDLFAIDFKNIKKRFDVDILAEYKVVKCSGQDAGFIAHKYLMDPKDELVYSLLDITLGRMIKTEHDGILSYDGVDIAIELMENYPDCKIKFCTAHRVDGDNDLYKFVNKFREFTKLDLKDYTFTKLDDRVQHIYELINDGEGGVSGEATK